MKTWLLISISLLIQVNIAFSQLRHHEEATSATRQKTAAASRQSTYIVSATSEWGPPENEIYVHAGERLLINTPGEVDYGCGPACSVTADGKDCDFSHRIELKLNCEGLVGRIGDNPAFNVGVSYNEIAKYSGPLLLSLNDGYGKFYDNHGSWTSHVTIYKPDPCSLKKSCTDISIEDRPVAGDVIIFWVGDVIYHSGIVERIKTNSCEVESFKSRINELEAVVVRSPDAPDIFRRFGSTWTVYRTNRNNSTDPLIRNRLNTVTASPKTSLGSDLMGITDEKYKLPYIHLYTNAANCHGFTFNGGNISIDGYIQNNVIHSNLDFPSLDQSKAAKFILMGNGYRQIHATSEKDPCDHFNEIYNTNSSYFGMK